MSLLVIFALWGIILIAAPVAAYVARAGDRRRAAEELDRRNLRNAILRYEKGRGG